MKQVCDTVGGWMAYVQAFKAANPTAIIDYKMLMQQYIRGRKTDG